MALAGLAASQGLGAELGANLGDDENVPLPIETTKSWARGRTSCSKGLTGHYDSLCYSGVCGYREITNATYHTSPFQSLMESTMTIGDNMYYSTDYICMPSESCNTTTKSGGISTDNYCYPNWDFNDGTEEFA